LTALRGRAVDSPCTRYQVNFAIIADREARANTFAQRCTMIFGKGPAITGGGCLAAEKRCPVIIKVLEYGCDID
jgi:hypothetical protein